MVHRIMPSEGTELHPLWCKGSQDIVYVYFIYNNKERNMCVCLYYFQNMSLHTELQHYLTRRQFYIYYYAQKRIWDFPLDFFLLIFYAVFGIFHVSKRYFNLKKKKGNVFKYFIPISKTLLFFDKLYREFVQRFYNFLEFFMGILNFFHASLHYIQVKKKLVFKPLPKIVNFVNRNFSISVFVMR